MRSAARVYLAIVTIFVAVSAVPASAEILELDCGGSATRQIWVDLDKSTVTAASAWVNSNEPMTYPAQITPTSISRVFGFHGGPGTTLNGSINRIYGTYTEQFLGNASGSATLQCTRGLAPLPATKF
ncbi:MAG: hypothetical protein ACLQUZ_07665 [Rhizomicrobium sp.]